MIDTFFYILSGHPFDNSVAMEESYQDASPENDRSEMGQSSAKQDSEKELVYKKTLRLIELHKKLQESPALLQEQFDHLQNLEKGVSESITELKDASDSFCVKSWCIHICMK